MSGRESGRRAFLKAGVLAGVGGVAGCADRHERTSEGPDPLPMIRYAGVPWTQLNDLMSLFLQSDYLREHVLSNLGERYDVKLVSARSTPRVAATLAAGEADAGPLATPVLASATADNTISGGATVLAPLTYDGPRYADTYCSAAGADVSAVSDLAGGTLAVDAAGSAVDVAARIALRTNGVDPSRVTFRETPFNEIPGVVTEGHADVGAVVQPFRQLHADALDSVFDTTAAFDPFLKLILAVRTDFLEANDEVVDHWLADFWAGLTWWRDDANADARLRVAADVLGLSEESLAPVVQTERGYYHGEDGLGVDPVWLQGPVDAMARAGLLETTPDVRRLLDASHLPDEATTVPDLDDVA